MTAPAACASLVEGGPATGKTRLLIQRCADLIEEGSDPADVLVFCATPDAANRFAFRLGLVSSAAESVRVCTPRELFLNELATDAGRAFTGRDARLLGPYEMAFLFEDMKTVGEKTRRLKGLMGFFLRGMSELADWDDGWLVNDEERCAYTLMKECLAFSRGIAEPELANLFCKWAVTRPDEITRFQAKHVFVDDYHLLSRASQKAAGLLATDSICISADREGCAKVFESYPFEGGVREFLQVNPQARVFELEKSQGCAAARSSCCALRDYASHGTSSKRPLAKGARLRIDVHDGPSREVDEAADVVAGWISAGANPGDVVAAVTDWRWAANMVRALEARQVPVESALDLHALRGDVRDLSACPEARVLTALYLAANPEDGVAWRSWCGFGDWLGASSAFSALRASTAGNTGDIRAAIRDFTGKEPVDDPHRTLLRDRLRAAEAMVCRARGLRGEALLESIAGSVLGEGGAVPPLVRSLVAPFLDGTLPGDDACALAMRARARITLPRYERAACVHVGTLPRTCGATPTHLMVCGLVNGLFPAHACLDPSEMPPSRSEKELAEDARLLASVVAKPSEELVLSAFSETSLIAAERLRLSIHRVRVRKGTRCAQIEPSLFLDVIAGSAPR